MLLKRARLVFRERELARFDAGLRLNDVGLAGVDVDLLQRQVGFQVRGIQPHEEVAFFDEGTFRNDLQNGDAAVAVAAQLHFAADFDVGRALNVAALDEFMHELIDDDLPGKRSDGGALPRGGSKLPNAHTCADDQKRRDDDHLQTSAPDAMTAVCGAGA